MTGCGPTYVYRYGDWTGWGDRLAVARESGGVTPASRTLRMLQ